jgi:hypothetical protein
MDDAAVLTYNPKTPTPTKFLDDMKKEIYEHVESKAEAGPQEEVFEWREVVRGLVFLFTVLVSRVFIFISLCN